MITDEKKQPSDLFDQGQAPKRQNTWYFATNQLNLMYMLAAGLIMPPRGFGKKYYEDSLSTVPGWIPLFAGTVPKKVIDRVVKEAEVLRPVIVALNLSSLEGCARSVSISNRVKDIRLPDELTAVQSTVFIPAPLPTSFIECVYFSSKEEMKSCEQDARDYANVPLSKFKRGIKKQLFGRSNQLELSQQEYFSGNQDVSMDKFLAVGGMIAMLLNCGNMGELAIRACQDAFEGASTDKDFDWGNTVAQGLGDWIGTGTVPRSNHMLNTLFWGIVEEIINSGSYVDSKGACRETVLDFLKRSSQTADEKSRSALSKLITDLNSLSQFGDKNITELFESHTREFRRALILFFIRDRCADLVEFTHPLLTEQDYIAAALLFAAREKWVGLPLHMRDHLGLDEAVSHRMAAMAHRVLKTGLEIGPPPSRCPPLRELLKPSPNGWNRKQHEAALSLSRDMKWDCVSTRIRLGRGEYKLNVDASGVSIFLPGEAKAVETDINKEKFFTLMTKGRFIDRKCEAKAREILTK